METDTGEKYIVYCHNCNTAFDALNSSWCDCLTTEPSIICTYCLTCSCKANPAYKKKFWENAPTALWDKKWIRHRTAFKLPPNPPPEEVSRPLILLVEDDKDIQRVAIDVIQGLNYGLITANNGVDGLRLAKEYHPDLILSDAMMPKMDGREMCLQVKEDPATQDIITVLMSSIYTNAKYQVEGKKLFKLDEHLSKPLNFEKLSAVLAKYLKTT